MSAEPPQRPGAGEPDSAARDDRPRPYSRNDLFGPSGLFRNLRPATDDGTASTRDRANGSGPVVAESPRPSEPEPTQANQPQQPQASPYTPSGYAPSGYAPSGYAAPGQPDQPYPPGYGPEGYPPQQYAPHGVPQQGYPQQGYPQQGYPQQGYPQQGYPQQGYPQQGYARQEYAQEGNGDSRSLLAGGPPGGLPPSFYPSPDEPQGTRSQLVIGLVAAAVVSILVVIFAFDLLPGQSGDGGGPPAASAGTPSAAASSAAKKKKATASPASSESGKGFAPIPAEPWSADGLDFGYLTEVRERGDTVTIRFNRASFYYGDEATARNGGVPPDNDYLIVDENSRLRTFEIDPDATIRGNVRLGSDQSSKSSTLTVEEFVDNADEALESDDQGIPVWLRHENGLSGDVTALAEQYQP